jgi:hypothetical protein
MKQIRCPSFLIAAAWYVLLLKDLLLRENAKIREESYK